MDAHLNLTTLPDVAGNWTGPMEWNPGDGDWLEVVVNHDGDMLALDSGGFIWRERAQPSMLRLDLSRSEALLRVAQVLAAGVLCRECNGARLVEARMQHDDGGGTIRFKCPSCGGSGYLRKPAPCWHLLPRRLNGGLSDDLAEFSAPLVACHARRVAAGMPGVERILTPWLRNDKYPERHFRSEEGTDHNSGYCFWFVNERRWRYGFAFEKGGQAAHEADGRAKADAAALEAGCALVDIAEDGKTRTLRTPAAPEEK